MIWLPFYQEPTLSVARSSCWRSPCSRTMWQKPPVARLGTFCHPDTTKSTGVSFDFEWRPPVLVFFSHLKGSKLLSKFDAPNTATANCTICLWFLGCCGELLRGEALWPKLLEVNGNCSRALGYKSFERQLGRNWQCKYALNVCVVGSASVSPPALCDTCGQGAVAECSVSPRNG